MDTLTMRGRTLGLLSLLASLACTSSTAGPAADASASGGNAAGGAAGGRGGGSGGSQGLTGGSGGSQGLTGGSPGSTGGTATVTAGTGTGGTTGAAGDQSKGGGGGGASGGATGTGTAGTTGGGGTATGGVAPATGGGAGTASGGMASGGGAGAGGVGAGGATSSVADTVTRTASTFAFRHFPIQTNSAGVWSGPSSPGTQATSTTYDTVVLENGYLKVTLLPDYGGRILSILHKPTNRELLYQNPIGTPYLMGEDIFYYNYLVIMGGIFASFPEPEHGRHWNQRYDLKVVSESKDAITVRMSRLDDLDLATGVPTRYDVGRTDVLVEVDVTLRAGSTRVELGTKLTNTKSKSVPKIEYWTVTTLAPGSTPGKTAIPLNTRIMAAMEKVHLLESSWSWFGSAEERVSGEIFKWKNLANFKNWVDQGTAFANPDYRANWSGLFNDDNATGILRVSDNVQTPGLKLWTFGKDSLTTDVNKSDQWLRPTIEMWHGITPEFWTRGTMAAGEVRQWNQTYFPTLGLKDVTAASEHGALYLSTTKSGSDTVLSAATTLTLPTQTVRAILRLDGAAVAEQDVVIAAAEPTTVTATVPSSKAASGAVFQAELVQGDTKLLAGTLTLK